MIRKERQSIDHHVLQRYESQKSSVHIKISSSTTFVAKRALDDFRLAPARQCFFEYCSIVPIGRTIYPSMQNIEGQEARKLRLYQKAHIISRRSLR